MLRNILVVATSTVALAAAANAGDLFAPDAGFKDGPVYYSWTGLYVGADAGGAWSTTSFRGFVPPASNMNNNARALEAAIDNGSASGSSGWGGGSLGYNYQMGQWVLGVEASLSQLNLKEHRDTGNVSAGGQVGRTVDEADTNQLFTLRPRLGYAFDRGLFYVTGGLASMDRSFTHSQTWTFDPCPAVGCHSGSAADTFTTWTVGGGVQYALTNQWSLRAEYLYIPASDMSFTSLNPTVPSQPVIHTASFDHIDVLKAGIALKIDGDFAPLK